jgi:hypothetical protein
MQDEEIDKLISDAANQHHPPYDDKSWGKMEALLDEHLPVKKDRRRYVFFILLFLLLGGAIGTALLLPWKNNTAEAAGNGNVDKQPVALAEVKTVDGTANTNEPQVASQQPATNISKANTKPITSANVITSTNSKALSTSKNEQPDLQTEAVNKPLTYAKKGKTSVRIKNAAVGEDDGDNPTVTSAKKKISDTDNTAADNTTTINDIATSSIDKPAAEQKSNETVVKTTDSTATTTITQVETAKGKPVANNKKKTDKNFVNNFAITATAGADMSYIELNAAGKTQFVYGAGLNYFIGKHFRAGVGLYTTKKIYTAAPYQYKFAAGSAYPNLTGINADCKVYEIPVSLYYNFDAAKKHNWFGGISISSLLMKKETYDYLYKNPAGQTYNYVKTINNENKHYFSVLTLSGGYQYNLNNRFSFIAEPYLKLPLTGIGAGEIKLNSTGLLFTAVFKPFSRSKK